MALALSASVPAWVRGQGFDVPETEYAGPPVNTSGRLISTYQRRNTSDGNGSLQWTNTLELAADSYVWQPWFGFWRARGAVSRVDSETAQRGDSTANLFSGQVDVNLFHQSHFPFSAFAAIEDSRVDVDRNDLGSFGDLRTTRFGLSQQYQDRAGGGYYQATLQHDTQENFSDGTTSSSDRLFLNADRRGPVHTLGAVAVVNRFQSSIADSTTNLSQFSVSHGYRPHDRLSVDSNATLALVDATSDIADADSDNRTLDLNTQATWRAATRPLTLRGEANLLSERGTLPGATERNVDRVRLRGGARYEASDQLSFTGDVGVDTQQGDTEQTTTFQIAAVRFDSVAVPWREFFYTWNAGASVGNRTGGTDGTAQTVQTNIGHDVTRTWVFAPASPLAVVFNAGQELRVGTDTREGDLTQLLNRANLSMSYNQNARTSYLQASVLDLRSVGRLDTGLFTVNLVGVHSRQIGRYRNFDLTATLNYTNTSNEGVSSETDVATLEARYRDGRFFGLRDLVFDSRLRGSIDSLFASNEIGQRRELQWENELRYEIGLLTLRARATWLRNEERRDAIYYLSAERRF